MADCYDAIVIGAGVFGAWTAHHLRRSGRSVALLDAYGAGNNRASSGGETRIIRMGYRSQDIYTRWSFRSLELWTELFDRIGRPELFQRTGVLWTPPPMHEAATETLNVFRTCGIPFERLTPDELALRFPQIRYSSERIGIFEPESGVLLARRAVEAVVNDAVLNGADFIRDAAFHVDRDRIRTSSGELRAETFVFACGPWLPKIFPQILGGRIRPTRQEVFFFGLAPGDRQFTPPEMPAWIDFSDDLGAYAIPDVESRGFKLAFDRHGPEFDPDNGDRAVHGVSEARAFLAERFPSLAAAPLVESRVCQYENTSSGDFLIDRHPDFNNVWLVGGGSGHGFKHGPMVGEYTASLIAGQSSPDPRFALRAKSLEAQRAVY